MIDARDYKTRDELADAMKFERDLSELNYLSKKLAELELSFEFYKHRYKLSIEEIKSKQIELRNNISEYYKKIKALEKANRYE